MRPSNHEDAAGRVLQERTFLFCAVWLRGGKSEGWTRMDFELSYEDIAVLFFLTLGPLKAILPFGKITQGTEPAFRRMVAWRATAIATGIVIAVALLAPLILVNWHVSSPAVTITCSTILFYQSLRIVMQTPAAMRGPADRQAGQPHPTPAIAVFPVAIPAIVTAPGIAAVAVTIVLVKHDVVHDAVVVAVLLGIMLLDLLTLWNVDTILKHGIAGVLPVVGWVLAVLQASLAVQIMIYSLRVLGVLHSPAS
jgi:multiple antibiotic resistance protein